MLISRHLQTGACTYRLHAVGDGVELCDLPDSQLHVLLLPLGLLPHQPLLNEHEALGDQVLHDDHVVLVAALGRTSESEKSCIVLSKQNRTTCAARQGPI